MTDDLVMPILREIQATLADIKLEQAAQKRNTAILIQDVRMIRTAIDDMGATRVSVGEVNVLHEDVNRVIERVALLESRIAALESRA